MSKFYQIRVKDVRKETSDSVSIGFEIPENVKPLFSYQAGQYITLSLEINKEKLRRAYSLCSSPSENDFRIAVKKVRGGRVSTYLTEKLKVNDTVELLPPAGKFLISTQPENNTIYVAFAAGSGITPIFSMLKEVLKNEPHSTFYLYYCNKKNEDIIFKEELNKLSEKYATTFHLAYIFTQEDTGNDLYHGRIDGEKAMQLLHTAKINDKTAHYFICGPNQMIKSIKEKLETTGVEKNQIHYEYFSSFETENKKTETTEIRTASITIVMDGIETYFEMPRSGKNILDMAIENGVDAPFSCKGAVCCTCKAKVTEGKAGMEMNYSLSDEEVEKGFILTCQAFPETDHVRVDYDEIF
ncbi:MAG: 2Fe-2S iron-sulfur cluster binding domain-containing protein [Flavobacteriales bacterium]|nr:2Fe-2S iron-sulfur cluster binding domain-containing protein [Flavobacteriales bacterium]